MSENGEAIPLKPTSSSHFVPGAAAAKTFSSPVFLVMTLITAIIPIVQLSIGYYYRGQCPVRQAISTYMIVAGVAGLILVALTILLALTFMCFIADSAALSVVATCGVCANTTLTFIVSLFLFVWFIIGCVWVFSVRSIVQYDNPIELNYCHPILYKAAMALLIITIVWAVIQCCVSCIRQCLPSRA